MHILQKQFHSSIYWTVNVIVFVSEYGCHPAWDAHLFQLNTFAVYVPGAGWLEFDPTNNKLPFDQHITLAWGRDYTDVTPLKGIAFGGGQHSLSVSVDVLRLE